VSELVGSLCLGVADLITDAITYARLRSGEIQPPNTGYTAAFIVALGFGVGTTLISIAYRIHNARLMKADVLERSRQVRAGVIPARRQAEQHEFELAQTHRTKVVLSLSLTSLVAQGAAAKHIGSYAHTD
jgi:hypothetical protein